MMIVAFVVVITLHVLIVLEHQMDLQQRINVVRVMRMLQMTVFKIVQEHGVVL